MVLHYSQGHEESVGQFRFDLSLEKLHLQGAQHISVGLRRYKRCRYVSCIVIGTPVIDDSKGTKWVEFDLHLDNILEWWINDWETLVARNEPRIAMR